jgi:hypothetical protein
MIPLCVPIVLHVESGNFYSEQWADQSQAGLIPMPDTQLQTEAVKLSLEPVCLDHSIILEG